MTAPTIEHMGLLSNFWFAMVASDYSVFVVLVGSLIVTILSILATIHPEAKSIICLIKGWIYGFPGMTKKVTTSESSSQSSTTTTTQSTDAPEVKPEAK